MASEDLASDGRGKEKAMPGSAVEVADLCDNF